MNFSLRLLSFGVVGVFIVGGGWLYSTIVHMEAIPATPERISRHLLVQVTGAVVHPGLFVLNDDSRVFHAIAAAGGFALGADTRINLAAHLYDGQRLEIPYLDQVESPVLSRGTPSALMGTDERQEIPAGADGGEVSSLPLPTSTPGNYSCSEAAVGSGGFVWPADAHFLSGMDFSYHHPGLDIAAGLGVPVYAADSGFIRAAGNDPSGYGNMLEIDHGNGYSTVYAHLNTIEVVICQSVNAGQQIGSAGDTGNADGVHLHFEVIQDGVYIDPWLVLPKP